MDYDRAGLVAIGAEQVSSATGRDVVDRPLELHERIRIRGSHLGRLGTTYVATPVAVDAAVASGVERTAVGGNGRRPEDGEGESGDELHPMG